MTRAFFAAVFAVTFLSNAGVATVPTAAQTFGTNVQCLSMTPAQEVKIRTAEQKIKAVIASEEFRVAVLNHTYNGKKTFVDNKGLSNEQIYQQILDGAELLYPSKNNAMDMGVKLYYENTTTIGFTTKAISYININTKYFNTYSPTQVAHNMMHEWMHKIGFDHAMTYSPSRDFSVPYAIGSIVLKLAAKY